MNNKRSAIRDQFFKFNLLGSLKNKLILFFLAISLIPLVSVGIVTYIKSQDELRQEAFSRLVAVRNAKAREVSAYLRRVDQNIRLMSRLDATIRGASKLEFAVNQHDLEYIRNLGFLGRPELLDLERSSYYGGTHKTYHPLFSEFVRANGYTDILLVSLKGDVIYSYAKRDDFATNLLDGPYRNTALSRLFQNLSASTQTRPVQMTGYGSYPPAGDTPVGFIGTPIVQDDIGPIGILIYELSWDQVDELMKDNIGLGATGEIYLVDENYLMRSRTPAGIFVEQVVHSDAVEKGLQGGSNFDVLKNYNGVPVLSAYQPLEAQWVLIAEVTQGEAFAAASRLFNLMLVIIVVTTMAVILIGLFLAGRIADPIIHLTAIAQQVTGGNLNVKAVVESRDEIGQLSTSFNTMTTQLQQLISSLEEQAHSRTTELLLSMEMGQRAASLRDPDELLPAITEFIASRFHLYYTQIYLVDDIQQNLILKAGAGEVGEQLLAQQYSLPLGSGSIVGQAASLGRSIVAPDTGASDIYKPEPLLPFTCSELAIPLMIEGQVIGVLDMQGSEVNTFREDNITVYEAMGVQLAIAIDSARQWTIAQEARRRTEEAVKQLTREAWVEKLASARQNAGFIYDLSKVTPLAAASQMPLSDSQHNLSAPLVIQDQAIGYLAVTKLSEQTWTEDEQALLQAVAQQLAQKAENLRLFEDTRQRATREQIARRIIDRVRASRNIETALKTATEELNKALGTARAVIDLQMASPPQPAAPATTRVEDQGDDSTGVKVTQAATPTNGRPIDDPSSFNFDLDLG